MAENKKSFILYADLILTVDDLPREIKGDLFQLILDYVNDRNPEPTDLLLKTAFNPIKLQLKRDLRKWEDIKGKRSEAGKASAKKRQHVSTHVESVEQKEHMSTVTVNGTVTVNDTVTEQKDVFDSLKAYYGFNDEISHGSKHMQISSFLRVIRNLGQTDHFINQFKYYKKYKEVSQEKIHSFVMFIAGGWDAENWEHKFKNYKSKDSGASSSVASIPKGFKD